MIAILITLLSICDAAFTSFYSKNLGIFNYPLGAENADENSRNHNNKIVNETVLLLSEHHLRRDALANVSWNKVAQYALKHNSPSRAIEEILINVGDRYARFLSKESMKKKRESIKGEVVSAGVIIERKLRMPNWTQFRFRKLLSMWKSIDVTNVVLLHITPPLIFKAISVANPRAVASCSFKMVLVATVCLGLLNFLHPTFWRHEVVRLVGHACDSGLHLNDALVSINGQSVVFLQLKRVRQMLEEEETNIVTVKIERVVTSTLCELLDFNITRKVILTPKIKYYTIPHKQEDCEVNLGCIKIDEFTDQTPHEVQNALKSFKSSKFLPAIIFDLRGNPGGSLSSALDVAAMFLPKGKVLTQLVSRDNVAQKYYSLNNLG